MLRKRHITPGEFAERMKEIAELGDKEAMHSMADRLLCEVLEEKGFKAGVEIFKNMNLWYA